MRKGAKRRVNKKPKSHNTLSHMHINGFPQRLFLLDISRGIAALAVVTWHWQMFWYDGYLPPGEFARNSQPLYGIFAVFFEVGYMGVDFFFLLSGFIFFWLYHEAIQTRNLGAKRFFIDRFSRLYPLHLLTLILVAVLQSFYFSREGTYFAYPFNDTYHFFLNLIFASSWGIEKGWSFNGPSWSLSVEVLLYASFFIASIVIKRPWIVVLCLAITICTHIKSQTSFNQIYRGAAVFYLGGIAFYATASINTRLPRMRYLLYMLTLLGWFFVFIYFYFEFLHFSLLQSTTVGKSLVTFLLFPFTICSLILFEIHSGYRLKKMSWIGDITYSSYLLHFPLNLALSSMVGIGLLHQGFHFSTIYFIIYFFILIAISLLAYHKIERPLKNVIRKSLSGPSPHSRKMRIR